MDDQTSPQYGIDTPGVVAAFGVAGVVFFVIGIATAAGQGVVAAVGPWVAALLCLAAVGAMIRSSKVDKPARWRMLLDDLHLAGAEKALDIGCGRGLVTVELAKRLPKGSVTGVDIWRKRDQSGNTRANAVENIRRAGVEGQVKIIDADATDLPFGDGEFHVVTAGHVIHNLPLAAGRGDAMKELMRVTKPGGRIVIVDTGKTIEYQTWLLDAEWDDVKRTRPTLTSYPPVRTVTATKPGSRSVRKTKK